MKLPASIVIIAMLPPLMAAAALPEVQQEVPVPHPHDQYLESVMKVVAQRELTNDELQKLAEYIHDHPNDSDGHLVLANAYNKLGMDGMYSEEVEQAWRLAPINIMYVISAMRSRAITSDPEHFSRLVYEAFQTYKNNAANLSFIGSIFQSNNQNTFALRFFGRAMELQPNDLQVRASYCASLLALRKYKDLLKEAEILRITPQTSTLGDLLEGVAYFNLSKKNKALLLLKKAYDNAANQPEIAEAYFDALVAMGRQSEAVEPALMALAMQPPRGTHLDALKIKIKPVIARASVDQLQTGIKKVSAALPVSRGLAYFYFALGDVLDKTGRYLNAANCFNKGLEMDNSLGRAHMRLAHDMEILGMDEDAVKWHYTQAAMLAPSSDNEVKAKYLRMKEREAASKKDIAAQLKTALNQAKYGTGGGNK